MPAKDNDEHSQIDNAIENIENGSENENNTALNDGIIQKFVELLTGISSEERIKSRKLKEIRKSLQRSKFKFYNFKKDQILPALGAYLYEIYRLSQNVSRFFDVKNHSNSIKQYLFDTIISKKQQELKQKLERENIENVIKQSKDSKKALDEIRQNLNEFVKNFDSETVRNINTTYNQIVDFSNITSFDWYFLIHKFDAAITEGNFSYKPTFDLIEGKYIIDELITLNDDIFTLNLNSDWKNIFEYLKSISQDSGLIDIMKKLIQILRVLKRDEYLTKIIQLISRDPFFQPKEFPSKTKIVQEYIHNFQVEIQSIVENCIKQLNKDKLNKILMEIFRSSVIIRLKYYSQRINDLLMNKGVSGGFKYVDPLNYLKAFLLDICKGEIKPRIDILIIKGTWDTNTHSSDYSLLLEGFNSLSDDIVDFDSKCAEDDTYGRELKKLIGLVKHDPKARLLLKKLTTKVDGDAANLIVTGMKLINDAADKFKLLLEDYNSKAPKIVINFYKIKWDFSENVSQDLSAVYKKLMLMLSLLKNYIKEDPSKEKSEVDKE